MNKLFLFCIATTLLLAPSKMKAQEVVDTTNTQVVDDDMDFIIADSLDKAKSTSNIKPKRQKRDWNTWKPDVKRALWLSIVLPGAGQIYNHKYWKLPIFYGGVVGCVYAMTWNNNMYRDYSQAYMDLVDNNPSTQSYNQFLHLGNKITPENEARYEEIFRKRKDRDRKSVV